MGLRSCYAVLENIWVVLGKTEGFSCLIYQYYRYNCFAVKGGDAVMLIFRFEYETSVTVEPRYFELG